MLHRVNAITFKPTIDSIQARNTVTKMLLMPNRPMNKPILKLQRAVRSPDSTGWSL
jgi:hypothetical protein